MQWDACSARHSCVLVKRTVQNMAEKTIKPVSAITADDLPTINTIIAKGDRAEVGPGPNGTIKISRVKRVIVKSGR